ncbi:MAG: winged helix DNA-binding domain-containing protein [Dysgonamonadaceae bacterium]|jgi:hypothetical protein|nr:winged helix DNA-binding domain-containing protein [Dysgonamonadaceae bacterium]
MINIPHIRLASHQLSGTHHQTPEEVVAWMGAVQAQDYHAAEMAISIRLPNSIDKNVENAFNQGKILRTHVLRPTWHFVTPENIRWMLSLSAARIISSSLSRDRELEITEALYSQTNRIIQKSLEGGRHLTREAVGKELEKHKIIVNSARLVHFLMRTEVEGIVCSGALQGKDRTYALLDERAPAVPPLHKEEALAKLAQLYFQSHCPATLQDFAWWSGLSPTEARQGLESLKSGWITEKIDSQIYWIREDYQNISHTGNFCCLLPAFDEYIIAYKDRSPVLLSEHHNKAVSSNGVFRAVIIANGQVVGLWKKSSQKKNSLLFEFFEPVNDELKERIKEKAKILFYE